MAKKTSQQKAILEYLEKEYALAKLADDTSTMCRLSRAILAFNYDDLEKMPTWGQLPATEVNGLRTD